MSRFVSSLSIFALCFTLALPGYAEEKAQAPQEKQEKKEKVEDAWGAIKWFGKKVGGGVKKGAKFYVDSFKEEKNDKDAVSLNDLPPPPEGGGEEVAPPPPQNFQRSIIYGRSDSCDDSQIAQIVDFDTDCSELSPTTSAWSVKVNGRCENISDTNVRQACVGIQAANAPNVVYGRSDSCDSSTVAAVITRRTSCANLSATDSAWSVKINGQCQNISDTNVRSACNAVRANDAPNVVYGRTDSCDQSQIAAVISNRTDCSQLSSSESAWSIKLDGQCVNISDTNVRSACTAVRARNARDVVYGRTDSCDASQIEAVLDGDWVNCDTLSSTTSSWSIKVDGQCQNISDTNVRAACTAIRARGARYVVYGRTDSCDDTSIEAILDGGNVNCESLSASTSSWSIKYDGRCENISDTNVRNACRQLLVRNVRNAVYGRTDSCSDEQFAFEVNRRTDCNRLPNGNDSSWSVKINGQCRNISDTTMRQSCLLISSEL